jgi:soluble lytic murein transglycosylase-like protein
MKLAALISALVALLLAPACGQTQESAAKPAEQATGPVAKIPDRQLIQGKDNILWEIKGLKGFLKADSPLAAKYGPMLREAWGSTLKVDSLDGLGPASERIAQIKRLLFADMNPGTEQMPPQDVAAAADAFQEKLKIFISIQRTRVGLNAAQQKQLNKVKKMVSDSDDPAVLSMFYDRIRSYGPGDSPVVAASAVNGLPGALDQIVRAAQSAPGRQLPRGMSAHGASWIPSPAAPLPQAAAAVSGAPVSEDKIAQIAKQAGINPSIVRLVVEEARRQGVDYRMVLAVIQQESSFNPRATSSVGAKGLMQIMPGTGRGLGVRNSNDLYNPLVNIRAGIRYLKGLWDKFTDFSWSQLASFNPFEVKQVKMAIAAYNAGPGAVAKYNGVPPYQETRDYVVKVLRNYVQFRRIFPEI